MKYKGDTHKDKCEAVHIFMNDFTKILSESFGTEDNFNRLYRLSPQRLTVANDLFNTMKRADFSNLELGNYLVVIGLKPIKTRFWY